MKNLKLKTKFEVRCVGPQVHTEGRCRSLLEEHTFRSETTPSSRFTGTCGDEATGRKTTVNQRRRDGPVATWGSERVRCIACKVHVHYI